MVAAVGKVGVFTHNENHRPAADCLLTERTGIKQLIFSSEGGIILFTDNINGIKGEAYESAGFLSEK